MLYTPKEFTKDPDAIKDYVGDWSAWLGEDVILTSTWDVSPVEVGGLSMDSNTYSQTTTKVWLRGGIPNRIYKLRNRVTTGAGRTQDVTLRIVIKES